MSDITTEQAINHLQQALLSDEGYRISWRANIACAIMDTHQREGEPVHEWRNRCADTFLHYLTAGHPDDPITKMNLPGMMSVAVASGQYPEDSQ